MAKLKLKLKHIQRLELFTKGAVSTKLIGKYKSVFKGKGLEFAGYREYAPFDDASMIDWKASSRANEVLVKEMVEERNLDVFFLIDVSSSMVYGSENMLKNEYAAELVASLGFTILHAGDSVGFAMFTNKIIKKTLPFNGVNKHYFLLNELAKTENYGGKYDLIYALEFISNYLERGSILIIVSDFIGLKGDWGKFLKIASNKFDIIGMMIRDPRDKALPELKIGNVLLGDPYSDEQIAVNTREVAQKYKVYVSKQERMVKETFLRANCDFLELVTNQDFIHPVFNFFKSRGARIK